MNKQIRCMLISPPAIVHELDPGGPGLYPQLGLAYIAAVLEENNYEVKILDALASGIDRIKKEENGLEED